jgi:hypothetical protein
MAVTFVDATTPGLETVNTATHNIITPAGILAGDFLFLIVGYASGTVTNTLTTNPVGFIKLGESGVGGAGTTIYYKQNAQPADSSQTITITTSINTIRISKFITRWRGVTTSGSPFGGFAVRTLSSRTTYDAPAVIASAANGILTEIAYWSVTGQTANAGKTIPDLTAAPHPAVDSGLTKIAAHWTGGAQTTGNSEMVMAYNASAVASGASVGGHFWTPEVPAPATAGNAAIWTIVLLPVVVATSSRPTGTVSSTGHTVYGGVPTIHEAMADELNGTGVESGDNPAGTTVEVNLGDVLAQDTISLLSKLETSGTGSISYAIAIRQNTTVVCSKTVVVAAVDGVVDDVLLSTSGEAAAMTITGGMWQNLRARYIETAV